MQQRGIVHPDLMVRLQPNFYPSLCTIQEANTTRDEYGQEISSPINLPGNVDIPCRISPMTSQETRTLQQVYATSTHHIALNGYYPAISAGMLAVVDGVSYQVEGPPQHDGNQKTTRIYVRQVV